MKKVDKIKVLKQEIRGIKKTIRKYSPNPMGLRRFNKHLKARQEKLIGLENRDNVKEIIKNYDFLEIL